MRFTLALYALSFFVVIETNEDRKKLAHGFGDDVDWVEWDDAVATAEKLKKPIFLLIHKSWCGACKALKRNFQSSKKIEEFVSLSKNFVMVNTENDEEPDDQRYAPDGGYIPRLFFLDETGEVMKEINNKKSYPRTPNYFPEVKPIVNAMKRALSVYRKEGAFGDSPSTAQSAESPRPPAAKVPSAEEDDDMDGMMEQAMMGGCPYAQQAMAAQKEEKETKESDKAHDADEEAEEERKPDADDEEPEADSEATVKEDDLRDEL